MSDQSTPNQVGAADQARCVLVGSRKINAYCNCSGVLVKLLVFSIMLGVIPIGSYFGTLDRVWNGMFLSTIDLELLLNHTNGQGIQRWLQSQRLCLPTVFSLPIFCFRFLRTQRHIRQRKEPWTWPQKKIERRGEWPAILELFGYFFQCSVPARSLVIVIAF